MRSPNANAPLQHTKFIYLSILTQKRTWNLGFWPKKGPEIWDFYLTNRRILLRKWALATPPKLIYTYKSKPLKGLKLCILPHQIQVFLRKGTLPPPGALYVDLDLTHGFLRFALSPSKQFLKVGSPGVHHLSHFGWKMKCFVIPHHAFFCVMNKPYIDYIKLLTYRHNLSWIQLK